MNDEQRSYLTSSKHQAWETPQELFNALDREFHFTLDAAATAKNAKCSNFFTVARDGLKQNWGGQRVFCNPPYGREVKKWVKKAYEEAQKPNTIVCLLVASRTDTQWFHDYIYDKAEIRFIRGRLKFEIDGKPGDAAPFPSLIAIYRSKDD